uniref:Uncharacterized protein n=1 Tax=Candidatus Kentrum sp. DK TaxID=2126562 RepID=A0A450SHU4_9GAMM|nr:MAG: hypothetical protein BECKDK2373C_GA0170839_10384 [Candidatus Kentron sp. DK]
MNLQFFAKAVEYDEAIGGNLIRASFREDLDDDPFNSKKKHLVISQLYEFPDDASLQWYDGESGGHYSGSEVSSYKLTEQLFELKMTNNVTFTIQHRGLKKVLAQIRHFLQNELGTGQ